MCWISVTMNPIDSNVTTIHTHTPCHTYTKKERTFFFYSVLSHSTRSDFIRGRKFSQSDLFREKELTKIRPKILWTDRKRYQKIECTPHSKLNIIGNVCTDVDGLGQRRCELMIIIGHAMCAWKPCEQHNRQYAMHKHTYRLLNVTDIHARIHQLLLYVLFM